MDDVTRILGYISTVLGIILLIYKVLDPPEPITGLLKKLKEFLSKPIGLVLTGVLIVLGVLLIVDSLGPVRVAIKTSQNHYVTAMDGSDDWLLKAPTNDLGFYSKFTIRCHPNGTASFQTRYKDRGVNRYVTAADATYDWKLRGETIVLDDYEEFTLLDGNTGELRLCSEVVESLKSKKEVWVALQTWHKKGVSKGLLLRWMGIGIGYSEGRLQRCKLVKNSH